VKKKAVLFISPLFIDQVGGPESGAHLEYLSPRLINQTEDQQSWPNRERLFLGLFFSSFEPADCRSWPDIGIRGKNFVKFPFFLLVPLPPPFRDQPAPVNKPFPQSQGFCSSSHGVPREISPTKSPANMALLLPFFSPFCHFSIDCFSAPPNLFGASIVIFSPRVDFSPFTLFSFFIPPTRPLEALHLGLHEHVPPKMPLFFSRPSHHFQ